MSRRRRKIKYRRICFLILAAALLLATQAKKDRDVAAGIRYIWKPDALSSSGVKLHSPYAILISLSDRKELFQTGSGERIYPASLTKLMTAIVAIENIPDLHMPVVLPEEIYRDLYAADASMAGFLPGEEVTAIDLLYGALLPSGADASIGLALLASGSENEFVKLMNEKGKELGMEYTHFTNASGLHDEEHYTTVRDMAKLLLYALENDTFRRVFTSERHSTAGTNLHPGGITFYSTLFSDMNDSEFEGGRILGGKTGYTSEAGLCLASLAEKNGKEYILVTAGAAGDHKTEQYNITDALTVYGKYLGK